MSGHPTDRQRDAIEASVGPTLVVAGPGAGKTYCLIHRIARLIGEHGAAPARICAVTFTNKAAEEVATRLHEVLGSTAADVTRGTLHALCVEILREHGAALAIPRGFGIADEPYQLQVLARLNVFPARRRRSLLSLFSRRRFQHHALTPDDERVYGAYLQHLRRRDLLDFDQLIERTAELFRDAPAIARQVAARWDHVLVDEFQDLDEAQYEVLAALAEPHGSFYAVGDDEQSIFSWRGAAPEVLRRFCADYGIAQPIVLDLNRRCARQIFEAARKLSAARPSLFRKDLYANRASPFPVEAWAFRDEDEETGWIVADVERDLRRHDLTLGEIAVLYRRHDVGTTLEGAFLRGGIPCRLARGRALLDDAVVRYVVAALNIMRHPTDPLHVARLGEEVLPQALVERLRAIERDEGIAFLDAVRRYARTQTRTDPDTKRAWRFFYQTENLRAMPALHDSLDAIVDALLSQGVGPYRNLLEELHDELTDPAEVPAAARLAEALGDALHGMRQVVLDVPGPERVPMIGLLRRAGVTTARYAGMAEEPTVLRVRADPLTLFKALQLVHSRAATPTFADFVAFDLETTDRDVRTCEAVEIGAVRVRAGSVVDRFRELIKPRGAIAAGAAATHGYTAPDLEDAPAFEEVWPRFRTFVGDDLLVAHNGLRFDVPVLRRLAQPLGGVEELVFFDSFVLARSLLRAGNSLEALAHRFGVPLPRAHHALDDSEALAGVLAALDAMRIARARKAALVEALEYLVLALAFLPRDRLSDEQRLLFERASSYPLSRYGESLDFYTEERKRLGADDLPARDQVIELLGGRRRYERLQMKRTAEERYPEAVARLRRVLEASRRDTLEASIDAFRDQVALSTSQGAETDPHRVNLLTLHSTKGLEFSRVYIVGVEDHEIPGYHAASRNLINEIDEGRRLLYVGMTRARDRLVLTRVSGRNGKDAGGNRFLDEMGLVARRR